MAKTRKAAKLPIETYRRIAKFKEKNPSMSFADIAHQFNCTKAQAENAHKRYLQGKLGVVPNTKTIASIKRAKQRNADDLMQEQMHNILAEMSVDRAIVLTDRVDMIDKVVRSMKSVRQMSLQQYLRGADAEFIAWLYRKYVRGNMSDEEIIKTYQTDMEKWKIDSAA